MNNTVVIGASMIPMGKHKTSSYTGLGAPAAMNAIKVSGIELDEIDSVICGHAFGGMLTAQRIAKEIGIGSIPMINVDNACSSGATAMNIAVSDIASGKSDVVLVIGVDKLTQFGGGTLPLVVEDPEVQAGMVMPALYAMRAKRFLYERSETADLLAAVSVKARNHGVQNPFAQFRKPVTVEEVLASRSISDPLTLLQCCPTGDGAAALIMVSDRKMRKMGISGIRVSASVLHSGKATSGFRNMLHPEITYQSARDAYEQAGLGPDDIDMVELHDAFTIAELIYYEALGLCPEGDAAGFLRDGNSTYGGKVVVNPSGGLLAKGHPVGASGVAQVVEAYWQLTGRAGKRQIEGARTAMTHVTGGGIANMDHGACTVHIFETTS
ncbi:thiolase family protein [Granulosicoccus sp. 3-233]|uniref:thiolase family protein n=1 Tax=Granulosicoccus sp. 3-233 TaxID=3417969 RepID=UPI003D33F13B